MHEQKKTIICQKYKEKPAEQCVYLLSLPHLGVRTGIPWVRFSHTIPVPAETAPVAGTGTSRPVISTVCYETRGIPFTRGYLYSNNSDMYIINSNIQKYIDIYVYTHETEPKRLSFVCGCERTVGRGLREVNLSQL